jgi:NAD+ synthetase
MRIALCQIDTAVGAFQKKSAFSNLDKIVEFVRKAAEEKAELAVFPELSISSYPPLDLLDRPDFIAAHATALVELQERLSEVAAGPAAVILGAIVPNPGKEGRAIQNASVVLHRGPKGKYTVDHIQPKRLLPTYDVFDEYRYFQPGTESRPWKSQWGTLGLCVCEDSWFDDVHQGLNAGRSIYSSDPALALKESDILVNVSASPFELNKRARRREQLAGFVRRAGAPMVYVNQVGANDEILFDGGSAVYSAQGEVLFEMPSFREALALVEFDQKAKLEVLGAWDWNSESGKRWKEMPMGERSVAGKAESEIALLHKALIVGIRGYFKKTGFQKAVLGLSGGIDSAVVACLAAEALGPKNVLGVAMPSQYSSSHSLADAEALASNLGIEFRVHSLKFLFTTLLMELKPSFQGLPVDSTEENIQARLRAVILMALANKRSALVLSTGNKSELGVGFCTTYGDMAGALAPLGDLYKTRVYELANDINSRQAWIPMSSITKPPSAELRPNQTDQDSLPPYDVLDPILERHIEGLAGETELVQSGFDRTTVSRVLHLVQTSEFKRRQAAPVLKVTSKAFGLGRRIPVAKL